MKKLQVSTPGGWKWVFCNNGGSLVTTEEKSKALPTLAAWGEDDLTYFKNKFAANEFRLSESIQ